jgi:Holliday junction resolvasome RuvABC DNA-binding subunit
MIRFVEGLVIEVMPASIVVAVGGLGYQIYVTKKSALLPQDRVALHTYLAVRETALDLYA